jgi:uncharacterized protein
MAAFNDNHQQQRRHNTSSTSVYANWPEVPYHDGELEVQKRLGVHEQVMTHGPKAMRPFMPQQHIDFFMNQPFVVAAAREHDNDNKMWATLLFAAAGTHEDQDQTQDTYVTSSTNFITSPDPTRLTINTQPLQGDALQHSFQPGTDLGLLGIEFATRRRNRVMGRVVDVEEVEEERARRDDDDETEKKKKKTAIEFRVDISVGNCPQYIKPRDWWTVNPISPASTTPQTNEEEDTCAAGPKSKRHRSHPRPDRLNDEQIKQIRQAETVFIATGYRPSSDNNDDNDNITYGNDASHRGGTAGFLKVSDDGKRVMIPDYAGNNMFMSIGNLVKDPRMGLTVPLYTTGGMIQMTGTTIVHWTSTETDQDEKYKLEDFPGAQRWLEFVVDEVNELPAGSLPIRWDSGDDNQLQLQVYDKIDETNDVTSFYLAPVNGESPVLPDYKAGQHLTLTIRMKNGGSLSRSYSLSSYTTRKDHYRISVRRDPFGTVSRFLHDDIENGDILNVQRPAGDFLFDPTSVWKTTTTTHHDDTTDKRILFLSAGIGVTPILSMLHSYVDHNSQRRPKAIWVHSARDGAHHPFQDEVKDLCRRSGGDVTTTTVYTRPNDDDTDKGRYDISGRLDGMTLQKILVDADVAMDSQLTKFSVYICGPAGFVASMQTSLNNLGIPEANIEFETF